MKIIFEYGKVYDINDLPPNSIALDGTVQGPHIDNAMRRYSFDHHGNCLRMVTLATCQQVLTALTLGLVVDDETHVYVNDLDADTFVALWLLTHSSFDYIEKPKVKELVERVGLVDAHGPLFPRHPLHELLSPPREVPQTLEMITEKLGIISKYLVGEYDVLNSSRVDRSTAYGWSPQMGWQKLIVENGFQGIYKQGFLLGVLYNPCFNNTTAYTIGKRSDLVPVKLGPASKVRPAKNDEDYNQDSILGALALAERKMNHIQPHDSNWGGASSIGGSPRNIDQSGSVLTPQQVVEICMQFTPKG